MPRNRLGFLAIVSVIVLSVCHAAPASAQTAPSLGVAQSFGVLSGTASVSNTGASVVNGDLGTSGAAGIGGFTTTIPAGPGTFTGTLHNADALAIQAQKDAITDPTSALNNLQGQLCSDSFGATIIGVGTLLPGVHCYTSSLGLTNTLTLDAQNNPNAVFIIKVATDLTIAGSSVVQLIRGAQSCNVFWAVQSSATVGSSAIFVGNLLARLDITGVTSAHFFGRTLAGRAIVLDTNVVDATVCAGVGGGGGGGSVPIACIPSTPADGLPTITTIPSQVIPVVPVNGSVAVGFTVGGGVIFDALVVRATSSNSALVPASAMVITKGIGGARVLTIFGADGRSGTTTITVTVTDPTNTLCTAATSTSFTLTIGAVPVPTLPEWALIMLAVLLACAGMWAMRTRYVLEKSE